MDLDFSAEQKMLREQARGWLESQGSLKRARQVLEGEAPHDEELWRGMAEMGWLGTAIPEQYGGVGMGYLELCVLAEEIGRVLAPVPLSSTLYLFAEAVTQFGSEDEKKDLLPRIAAGELIGTLAVAEQGVAPTEQNIQCSFASGALTGTKIAVPDGVSAHYAAVLARSGKGLSLCLVDLGDKSVERTASKSMDGSRAYATVTFSGTAASVLGKEGDGWRQWQQVSESAAVLFAFEQLGMSDSALQMAKEYALERYAFGRPIASYQAVKHRLADMYIGAQLARSNCYYGAWALSTGAAELPAAAAAARVCATEASDFNAKENIQLHGGMGFTWEFDCHMYYRRSKALAVCLGSPAEWKDRLITALQQSNRPTASG